MALSFLKQNTVQRRDLILKGKLPPTILMLSLPALLLGLVQAAIPLTDGLFINNIAGTITASAIYYCSPIVGVFGALAQGLSVAGMAMIGQSVGKGDFTDAKRISNQLAAAAFLGGIALVPLMAAIAYPVSLRVNPDISRPVFVYLALNSLVLPFTFAGAVYNAIKNAYGRPEDPFVRMIIMLILKVLFNGLFIVVMRWGIVGAVLSSLATEILISAWMYYDLFVKQSDDRLSLAGFRFDRQILRALVQIGFPSMLSSVLLNLGFVLINNEVQRYGAIVLNGSGIASNISNVCFLLPSAYGAAVTTLVSMNIGAQQEKRARSSCLAGSVISVITAVALIALVVPLAPSLTVLFTRQEKVLEVANSALSIYLYSVIGFGICMVLQGAFIGLGRTRVTIVISILRIWLLRYVFILLTEPYWGYHAVFWGNLFSNSATALITVFLILRVKWVSVLPPRRADPAAELAVEKESDPRPD